ncbi:hypothetical protein ABKV19_015912 [Rosa sericea]
MWEEKKEKEDKLQSFLASADDSKNWHNFFDEYNDEEVELTKVESRAIEEAVGNEQKRCLRHQRSPSLMLLRVIGIISTVLNEREDFRKKCKVVEQIKAPAEG